jgi:plastin-1
LKPKDIVEGSTDLNLAFLAYIFGQRKGLSLDSSKASIAETMKDDEVSKEERAFHFWMNSQQFL